VPALARAVAVTAVVSGAAVVVVAAADTANVVKAPAPKAFAALAADVAGHRGGSLELFLIGRVRGSRIFLARPRSPCL
jgi:hypothetical protein